MNVSRSNSLIYISILRITISMGFPLSFGHFLSIEDNFSCFLCREQLHQAMHMMFDEGVPAVFAGTMVHGEPIADMSGTMQEYAEA